MNYYKKTAKSLIKFMNESYSEIIDAINEQDIQDFVLLIPEDISNYIWGQQLDLQQLQDTVNSLSGFFVKITPSEKQGSYYLRFTSLTYLANSDN